MSCIQKKYNNLKHKYKKLQEACKKISQVHVGGTGIKRFIVGYMGRRPCELMFNITDEELKKSYITIIALSDLLQKEKDPEVLKDLEEKRRIYQVLYSRIIHFIDIHDITMDDNINFARVWIHKYYHKIVVDLDPISEKKEELPPKDPTKEEVPAKDPAKEEVPAKDPAKEEVPAQDPAKEEVPAQDPVKEEVPAKDP